ncbi:MAG: 50S ribosomal protein L21 [Deltaproteobacteria bacterium]|nr:50S ribosomal protein L21 [Deltaproteobacteria bacterium]
MHAVFKTGGKQYRVAPGDEVKVEKIPGNEGDSVAFDNVLMTSEGEQVSVGKPYIENVKVTGKITRQAKSRKVVVFKFKRRKGYRKKTGHRQTFTQVRIEGIQAGAQSEERGTTPEQDRAERA